MVSLVINTLNEEANIAACIQSVQGFADEVVVCDMYSNDRTREIAEACGARVVLHRREPFVERARRFVVEQTTGEWVLLLDADERATPELTSELREWMQREDVNMVNIRWLHVFMGRPLRHTHYAVAGFHRFFRRDQYLAVMPRDEDARVHSGYHRDLDEIPGQVLANERFIHLAYPTLVRYAYKTLCYYGYHEADGRFSIGQRATVSQLVMEPVKAFVASYVLHRGFLDGVEGFIACVTYAMYRFLVIGNQFDLQAGRTGDGELLPQWQRLEAAAQRAGATGAAQEDSTHAS